MNGMRGLKALCCCVVLAAGICAVAAESVDATVRRLIDAGYEDGEVSVRGAFTAGCI